MNLNTENGPIKIVIEPRFTRDISVENILAMNDSAIGKLLSKQELLAQKSQNYSANMPIIVNSPALIAKSSNFMCPHCGKCVNTEEDYKSHILLHTEKKKSTKK